MNNSIFPVFFVHFHPIFCDKYLWFQDPSIHPRLPSNAVLKQLKAAWMTKDTKIHELPYLFTRNSSRKRCYEIMTTWINLPCTVSKGKFTSQDMKVNLTRHEDQRISHETWVYQPNFCQSLRFSWNFWPSARWAAKAFKRPSSRTEELSPQSPTPRCVSPITPTKPKVGKTL